MPAANRRRRLRWHIERGDVVFPKSVTPERIKSNFELFDFDLDNSDMDAISGLDKQNRAGQVLTRKHSTTCSTSNASAAQCFWC
jgi:diketogulonate reductase-like aldo/keto reductase